MNTFSKKTERKKYFYKAEVLRELRSIPTGQEGPGNSDVTVP
jgi:hypothetical protein